MTRLLLTGAQDVEPEREQHHQGQKHDAGHVDQHGGIQGLGPVPLRRGHQLRRIEDRNGGPGAELRLRQTDAGADVGHREQHERAKQQNRTDGIGHFQRIRLHHG